MSRGVRYSRAVTERQRDRYREEQDRRLREAVDRATGRTEPKPDKGKTA